MDYDDCCDFGTFEIKSKEVNTAHFLDNYVDRKDIDIPRSALPACPKSARVPPTCPFGNAGVWLLWEGGEWLLIGAVRVRPSGGHCGGRRGGSRRSRNRLLRCRVVHFLLKALAGVRGHGLDREQPFFLPLLLLHPTVLEPDFHLSLIQLQRGGDLHPPRSGQVLVKVELLLQLSQLLGGEVGPHRVRLTSVPVLT